jgi:hypothetical protein
MKNTLTVLGLTSLIAFPATVRATVTITPFRGIHPDLGWQ